MQSPGSAGFESCTLIDLDMVVKHIQRKLQEKSDNHTEALRKLGLVAAAVELPSNVHVLPSTPQFVGMNTILQNPKTEQEDFIFYFDRLVSILIEKYCAPSQYPTYHYFTDITIPGPWI